jgi:hypothetical protein
VEIGQDHVTIERDGRTRTVTRHRIVRVKFWSKVAALELLAKKLGVLHDRHLPMVFDHAGYLEEVWRRIQAKTAPASVEALPNALPRRDEA